MQLVSPPPAIDKVRSTLCKVIYGAFRSSRSCPPVTSNTAPGHFLEIISAVSEVHYQLQRNRVPRFCARKWIEITYAWQSPRGKKIQLSRKARILLAFTHRCRHVPIYSTTRRQIRGAQLQDRTVLLESRKAYTNMQYLKTAYNGGIVRVRLTLAYQERLDEGPEHSMSHPKRDSMPIEAWSFTSLH
jgi:hypothetical protein